MPTSYVVGEHFEKFIKSKLAEGRYTSASELVRAGLRLIEEQEQIRQLQLEKVRRLVQESRDDDRPPLPADEVFAELRARIDGMAAGQTAKR